MTTLGDVLTFAGEPEKISDPANEMFVTVRLNGGGAVRRPIGAGKTPVPFTGYRISAGQLIYSRIDARNGAFAVVPAQLDGAVVSKDFPVFFIRNDRVDPGYLDHFLRGGSLQRLIRASSLGATNRQRITEERLLSFMLPLPSLPEQRRIAAILDQADALRATRGHTLRLLADLADAQFREEFGDPIANDHALPRSKLGAIAEIVTGNSPSRADAANFGDDVEWIKSDNLGPMVATAATERLSEEGRRKARIAPAGSILVTCIAGSPNSIGKSSLVDREVAFNQQINAIYPSRGINQQFLLAQFRVAPDLVRQKSTGGMKGLVSKSAFQSIDVLVPPLGLQRGFAARVEAINAQRAAAERSLESLDELFASLQARAFSGQL